MINQNMFITKKGIYRLAIITLWLPMVVTHSFGQAFHPNTKPGWTINLKSFETDLDRSLIVPVTARSFKDERGAIYTPEVVLGPTAAGFTGWRMKKAPRFRINKMEGQETTFEVRLNYDPANLPYTYQRLQIGLRNKETGALDKIYVYVYFTPYDTVEVWNQDDFESLNRVWDSIHSTQGTRQNIAKEDIPEQAWFKQQGALKAGEMVKQSIPGLAYGIPVPKKESEAKAAKTSFSGTVSGTVWTLVEDESLLSTVRYIWGIRVEVWERNIGTGDQLIATGYTDHNGFFSINFNYNSPIGANAILAYVSVVAETDDGMIRVRKRGGAIRSEDFFKTSPATFVQNTPETHHFGAFMADNHDLKPQLLHWTRLSREFVQTEVPGVLPTATSDRLDIMRPFVPGGADTAYFFPGGYTWDIIFVSALIFGSITPVGAALVGGATLLFVSNKDCLYIGQDSQLNEDVLYHEFGHYFMWHLQDESWIDIIEASFAYHTLTENNPSPKLSWTEGFASGFAGMVDSWARDDDGEWGADLSADYENRLIIPRNGINQVSLEAVADLEHGFVSEWNVACVLFDLWDGPTNPGVFGVPTVASSLYDDGGFDDVELTLAEIVAPLRTNAGTGGFHMDPFLFVFGNDQEQHLITTIAEYHEELMDEYPNDPMKRGEITRLFKDDLINNFTPLSFVFRDWLSGDDLDYTRTILTTTYDNNGVANGTTTHSHRVDVSEFLGSVDDYTINNVNGAPATVELIDDLIIRGYSNQNFATLTFNGFGTYGWQNVANHYGQSVNPGLQVNGYLNVDLDGGMTMTVHEAGRLQVGAGTGREATVTLKSGSTLILGGDGTGNVLAMETTYGTMVSMGFLEINAGSRFVVEEGATLIFNRGGNILLNGGNSRLEIYGNLVVATDADFDPMGDGRVVFGLPDEGGKPNLKIGPGSVISLIELDLEVLDHTYVMPEEESSSRFRIQYCDVVMGEASYWDASDCEFRLTDTVTYALNTDPGGEHQGYWVRNGSHIIDENIISNGSPSIYGIDDNGGFNIPLFLHNTTITGSTTGVLVENRSLIYSDSQMNGFTEAAIDITNGTLILNNIRITNYDIGILSLDCDANLQWVNMNHGETGWHAVNPTGPLSWIGGSATQNTDYGMHVLGGTTDVTLNDVSLNRNGNGLRVSGQNTVYLPCSEANENAFAGVEMDSGALLDIGNYTYFEAQDNEVNIHLNWAARPVFALGNNYLYVSNPTSMNVLGTIDDPGCAGNPVIAAGENDVVQVGGILGFDVTDTSGTCNYVLSNSMRFWSCSFPAP